MIDPAQRFPKQLFIWFLKEYVPGSEIAKCIRLSKKWKARILNAPDLTKKIVLESSVTVGPKQWKCLGDIEEMPPLPENIKTRLEQDCSYYKGEKLHKNWKLLLIPEKLNKEFLVFGTLLWAAKKIDPTILHQNRTSFGDEYVNEINRRPSYWVLVQRTQIKESFDKGFSQMKRLLTGKDRMLTRLETAALLILNYLNSKQKEIPFRPTSDQYYYNVCNVSRCFDAVICVGYASSPWLCIGKARQPCFNMGMAAARDL